MDYGSFYNSLPWKKLCIERSLKRSAGGSLIRYIVKKLFAMMKLIKRSKDALLFLLDKDTRNSEQFQNF